VSATALYGRVVTETEVWDKGTVLIEDRTIRAVVRERVEAEESVDLEDHFLVPGFVDLQVNGAFGIDVATEPGRVGELSAALVRTGTTSYLPTIVSLPLERYPSLLAGISLEERGSAEPLGLHLEGPFISPAKKGAHLRENVAPPDAEALSTMLTDGSVRMVTLAPEMPGAMELIQIAADRGILVSLGHSDAGFDVAHEAFDRGARGATHLFNAMSPFHHRDPGLPGAALSDPRCACGIIADGWHVHPQAIRVAFEVLGADRTYLVTDAISAAGMRGGEYSLAGRRVFLDEGSPRLQDGTMAGSVLRMDEALRNVLAFTGCTLPEAVKMASTTPARLIGEGKRKGRLAPGYDADVVALTPELGVDSVWIRGERVLEAARGAG
jgi:N-acetylglucosamine-6-phosphate deacetylase